MSMPHSGTSGGVWASQSAAKEELSDSQFGAPPSTGPAPRLAIAPFRSLEHRNYRLYFFGQLISLTGTWMQTAALAWLAFELTQTSTWPALISAAGWIPTFLF